MSQRLSDVSLVMEETAFPHSMDASGLSVSWQTKSVPGSVEECALSNIQETRAYCETIIYTNIIMLLFHDIFIMIPNYSHWLHVVHNQVHLSVPDRAVHYFQSLAQNINEVGHAYGQFRTRKSGHFHVLFTHDATIK